MQRRRRNDRFSPSFRRQRVTVTRQGGLRTNFNHALVTTRTYVRVSPLKRICLKYLPYLFKGSLFFALCHQRLLLAGGRKEVSVVKRTCLRRPPRRRRVGTHAALALSACMPCLFCNRFRDHVPTVRAALQQVTHSGILRWQLLITVSVRCSTLIQGMIFFSLLNGVL